MDGFYAFNGDIQCPCLNMKSILSISYFLVQLQISNFICLKFFFFQLAEILSHVLEAYHSTSFHYAGDL